MKKFLPPLALLCLAGNLAHAGPRLPETSVLRTSYLLGSIDTTGLKTSLVVVSALLDDGFNAISREVTVSFFPPEGPNLDAVSREVTTSLAEPSLVVRDAISREISLRFAEPTNAPTTNVISREITAWFDPERQIFYQSREISVGGTATLDGTVTFGDIDPLLAPTSVTVLLRDSLGNTVSSHPVTLVNGTFSVPNLPRGQFYVSVKQTHWLRDAFVVSIGASDAVPLAFELANGDIDGDNEVSILDYIALSEAYDTSSGDSAWNPMADLDADGFVSILDYIVLSSNYERQGDP